MTHLAYTLACALLLQTVIGQTSSARDEGVAHAKANNVIWDSPSKDYSGSMPLGNGDISLNAWVEESGDLVFYIGKTDSWDDNGRLLKIGRVRLALVPRRESPLRGFRQVLDLSDATMRVRFGTDIETVDIRLWVDANNPLVRVEVESHRSVEVVASIELWRTKPEVLPSIEVSDVLFDDAMKDKQHSLTIVEPDSILPHLAGRIGWFHFNRKSVGPAISAQLQGMTGFPRPDPLLHRTFGAVISADHADQIDDTHLRSPGATRHRFTIGVLTQHPSTPPQWLAALTGAMARSTTVPFDARRKAHENWWRQFWDRSWISLGSATDTSHESDAAVVGRAYALQRYINACAGRGRFPIKFNGSLFTVPSAGRPGDADYRQWGPGYWWQNTRLPYISMCASGDQEMMRPFFRMYARDLMPLFLYRTRLYLHHDGAYIPECIYFWGDVFNETYGWTPFDQRADKLQESRWHKWEWVSGLELLSMMMDYYEYTLDGKFLKESVLPVAHAILTFFDEQYTTDARGIMVMTPSQSLETWWECINPMPEVAGLHSAVERLLSLPEGSTSAAERKFWTKLKGKLPAIPTRTLSGVQMLAPADSFARKQNIENPELYAVFPFRLVTFNTPTRDLAVEAFRQREDRGMAGWRQDDVFAAYLGLADTARVYISSRARTKHADSRFPAFWGPNYDWVPDQDHGGILLKTLQAMLLQTDGKKIYLFPAWPREWNVDFKLHAPQRTTIQGSFVNGRLKSLTVTPQTRRKDLVILNK